MVKKKVNEATLKAIISKSIKRKLNEEFMFNNGEMDEVGNSLGGRINLGRLIAKYERLARQARKNGDIEGAKRYEDRAAEIRAKRSSEGESLAKDYLSGVQRASETDPEYNSFLGPHYMEENKKKSKLEKIVNEETRKAINELISNFGIGHSISLVQMLRTLADKIERERLNHAAAVAEIKKLYDMAQQTNDSFGLKDDGQKEDWGGLEDDLNQKYGTN